MGLLLVDVDEEHGCVLGRFAQGEGGYQAGCSTHSVSEIEHIDVTWFLHDKQLFIENWKGQVINSRKSSTQCVEL